MKAKKEQLSGEEKQPDEDVLSAEALLSYCN